MKSAPTKLAFGLLLAASALLRPDVHAQQPIQLVNDDAPTVPDSGVYVLFAGNPADVQAGGAELSCVRNLALPTFNVTTVSNSGGNTVVQCALLTNPAAFTPPTAPFPIKFVTGQDAGTIATVTAYDATTGNLTMAALANLPAPNDQFIVGATSVPLSSLPKSGTLVSTLSGRTQNIYSVTAQTLDSAVVYISTQPLTYLDAAPAIAMSAVTYQTVEITTGASGGATTSDVTAIDYFGLPVQIESVNQTGGATADRRTFYFKKNTIVQGLKNIGATLNPAGGLYLGPGQVAAANKGSPSPFPSFHAYLKNLAANKTKLSIAGTQNFGAPNPAMVYGISLGGGYQSTYGYDTVIAELPPKGSGNFQATMTPQPGKNSFTGAPSFYPPAANIESMTINLAAPGANGGGYDQVIYGATLNAQSFAINLSSGSLLPALPATDFSVGAGTSTTSFLTAQLAALNFVAPFTVTFTSGADQGSVATAVAIDSAGNVTLTPALPNIPQPGDTYTVAVANRDLFTQLYTNSTFSWAVANVLAGLDFGFAGSPVSGSHSATWYAAFPQQFPFGVARGTPDDGFYNPWSAFLYNASDDYSFAFSDRVAPSPLMSTMPATQNLRITLLPETQIDAPLVTTTSTTRSEIDLSWPATSGVTYNVATLPAISSQQIAVTTSGGSGTAKLTRLNAATPYEISVQGTIAATSTLGAQSSRVLPVVAITAGPAAVVSGAVPFAFSFTWAGATPWPSGYTATLNGTTCPLTAQGAPTGNVNVTGGSGTNLYVISIQDAAGKTVCSAVVQVEISATGSAPASFSLPTTPVIYGSTGALTPVPAQSSYAITYNAAPTPPSSPLVIGINFSPTVRKSFAAVNLPKKQK
ncbi:MAG TPA: hypothetical protein VG710_14700 [Opitutus sp.]|nr:hypothetical protein [Opitutus sp.]